MIAGLEFPTEGSLSIFGEEVGTLAPNKRSVNTVFQNYALFPHLTVLDNVGFGLKMQGVAKKETKERAMEMIELVQLAGLETRKPSQMSGGQQQRVALARALVNQPKVLLLDEPLGALDLKLRQEMQLELKKLQRDVGISFVFVTHDQEEALTMSDRIAVMHEGKLLQVASPEEIYESPANRFVADFIGRTNLLDGTTSDNETVVLSNGTSIRAQNTFPQGTKVSISIRPERTKITQRSESSDLLSSIQGTVETITYLGNARVYGVKFTWLSIEVREENRPGLEVFNVGDDRYKLIDTSREVVQDRADLYHSQLTLSRVTTHVAGMYICLVTNPRGTLNHKRAFLTVIPSKYIYHITRNTLNQALN